MKKLIITLITLLSLNLYGETEAEEKNRKAFDVDGNKYIIRPLYGIATKSDLGDLLAFKDLKEDPNGGKIAGIQVERYVYKRPYDFPVNITLQSSFITHFNSYSGDETDYYTNNNSYEINFGIKIYWTEFPWDKYVRTRLGVSEGLSYTSNITNLERHNQYYENNSNYLNYIDITFSFNAKDITGMDNLEDTYIGMGISHRSGIFGTINGVDGGSNNVTFFFETEI
jgi:outer membrane protein